MRIIAGEFKSRILKNPTNKRTHPMSEKIRGAIFNSMGDLSGLSFLDAFAGTGSIAVEALSRGAVDVHAVELDSDAFDILQQNRNSLTTEDRLQVHRANVKTWIKNHNTEFDIILADPPYDAVSMNIIDILAEYVKKDGFLILSIPPAEYFNSKLLKKIDEKIYGNSKIVFYKRN